VEYHHQVYLNLQVYWKLKTASLNTFFLNAFFKSLFVYALLTMRIFYYTRVLPNKQQYGKILSLHSSLPIDQRVESDIKHCSSKSPHSHNLTSSRERYKGAGQLVSCRVIGKASRNFSDKLSGLFCRADQISSRSISYI